MVGHLYRGSPKKLHENDQEPTPSTYVRTSHDNMRKRSPPLMFRIDSWSRPLHNNLSLFLLYSCSRNIVCFNPCKGFIVGKRDTNKYLKKAGAIPVLVAFHAEDIELLSAARPAKGLLLASKSIATNKLTPTLEDEDHATWIEVLSIETPYKRSGWEIRARNSHHLYLSAAPSRPRWSRSDHEAIDVDFSKAIAGEWEKFYLNPLDPSKVSIQLLRKVHELLKNNNACKADLGSDHNRSLTNTTFSGNNERPHFDITNRSANPYDEANRKSYRKIPSQGENLYALGPALDFLGRDSQAFSGTPVGKASQTNYNTRINYKPDQGPCIVATARNEALYLPDWCSYHFALGFEHIYLYTNDNEDETLSIALRIADLTGKVTVISNKVKDAKSRPQYKAYRHAFSFSRDVLKHAWCAVIDIDEYITIKPGKRKEHSIQDWIKSIKKQALVEPDVIALNWVFAGLDRSAPTSEMPLSLPQRSRKVLGQNCHIKSIFRPQKFLASQCHYPIESGLEIPTVVDSFGSNYTPYFTSAEPGIAPRPRIKHAAVMHFWHKSFAEYMWKSMRNTGDQPLTSSTSPELSRLEAFSKAFCINTETEHRVADWLMDSHTALTKSATSTDILNDQIIAELMHQSWSEIRRKCSTASKKVLREDALISDDLRLLLEQHVL